MTIDREQRQWKNRPYVGLEDIESGTGQLLNDKTITTVKSTTFGFGADHVLYGRLRPYLNKVLLPDFEGHCSTELIPILPSHALDRTFLWYWLTSAPVVAAIDATCTGARMPRANLDRVLEQEIPLPPLEEQRRIVAVLDEAFAAIAVATANAEKNLANARELFSAAARMAFSNGLAETPFETLRVEQLARPHKGSMRTGPFGSQLLHGEFVDEGVAVLGIDNAVANEFRWGKQRFITEEKFQSLSRFLVHPGDVIITIMGTCGRCAIVPDDIPKAINSKHLFCISLEQGRCLPGYLHAYFLHAPDARAYLEERAQGSIMAGLNMGIIKEMPIRLPPLPTQKVIVEAINSTRSEADRLARVYTAKLQNLAALKQSLLHRAFAGELTATAPEVVAA
ncbi:restriction endonuclease subunit S [Novosphingobium bradum]|uniref:Restriction endonuclease subunit S n=1 Tax=Novosphingobium bradum TaxID=1737444 RepID=A0ABV7ILP4_9SPHN